MSTTPDQPLEPEHKPEPSEQEAAAAQDALHNLPNQPQSDEAGATAYSAVPPPLPPIEDPAQGPVQDPTVQNKIGGMGEQPQTGFTPPAASREAPQQSPYQQQPPPPQQAYQQPQDQPGYGQQPQDQPGYGQPQYGQQPYGQPQYGQPHGQTPYGQQQPSYSGAQYGGGAQGGYQAAPPPPLYEQGYGYPGGGLPPGMPPLADWGQRAGAFALDNGPTIVCGWVAGAARSNAVDVIFGILGFVGLIWAIANAVRAGRTGQSYGKRSLGIRLARFSDGQPVGAALGFLRLFLNWLFWVACIVPGVLNLLWPLWDSKHQTLVDKIARSVVVRTR